MSKIQRELPKLVKVQLELPEEKVRQLEIIMEEAGIRTKKDFINNALTLFLWAVRETKAGRVIASFDEKEKKYREVALPALENLAVEAVRSRLGYATNGA